MVGRTLHEALESLKGERARLDEAISAIESLVSGGGGSRRNGRRGRLTRVVGVAGLEGRGGAGKGKRKNAPRGMLKAKIHLALKRAKKPLAPFELRDAVIKAGYPVKSVKTLYTAIFAATKRDPAVKKTAEGFSLK